MPNKNRLEMENFLEGSVNEELKDLQGALLVLCAPCNDDADYEHMTEAAVHNAIKPFTKWFENNQIEYEIRVSYGKPHASYGMDFPQFSVNVWIRPLGKKFTEEERMIFELKFANKFPIKNLQKYMEDLFK